MRDFSKKSEYLNRVRPTELSFEFEKFGTKIVFSIVGLSGQEDEIKKLFEKAREIYLEYDRKFSRFRKDSELSQLNSKTGIFQEVSKEMLEVVEKSLLYSRETGGYFDPRIAEILEKAGYEQDFSKTSRIQEGKESNAEKIESLLKDDLKISQGKVFFGRKMDFSGLVKGLVNDKVSELFLEGGFKNFVVDSGGDMFFSGHDTEGKKWTVDVEGVPSEKLTFEISGEAIATSGISKRKWERGGKRRHHLINPKNPNDFRFDLRTVTVIDLSTEKADIWAKTLFIMGEEKGIEFSKEKGIKSIFLDYSGKAWVSPNILKYKL